jgi:hypothetical protein
MALKTLAAKEVKKLDAALCKDLFLTANFTEQKLVKDYVEQYRLHEEIYELRGHEIVRLANRPQYSESNLDVHERIALVKEAFDAHLEEIGELHGKSRLDEPIRKEHWLQFLTYAYRAFRSVAEAMRYNGTYQIEALRLCFKSLVSQAMMTFNDEELCREMNCAIGGRSGKGQFFVVRKVIKEISERTQPFDGKITYHDVERCVLDLYNETKSDYDMCLYLATAYHLVKYAKPQELVGLATGANSPLELRLQSIESRQLAAVLEQPQNYSITVSKLIEAIRKEMV